MIKWPKASLPVTVLVKSRLDLKIFKWISECKPGTVCNGQCDTMTLFSWVLYWFYFLFMLSSPHSPLFLLILKSFVVSALILHLVKVEKESIKDHLVQRSHFTKKKAVSGRQWHAQSQWLLLVVAELQMHALLLTLHMFPNLWNCFSSLAWGWNSDEENCGTIKRFLCLAEFSGKLMPRQNRKSIRVMGRGTLKNKEE